MNNNQKAIDAFFDAYGNNTVHEYGKTFFDLLAALQQSDAPTEKFIQDTTAKFSSLFSLISGLKPAPAVQKELECLN
jgi:hypothetical protein